MQDEIDPCIDSFLSRLDNAPAKVIDAAQSDWTKISSVPDARAASSDKASFRRERPACVCPTCVYHIGNGANLHPQKENIMKNYRILDLVTLALTLAGYLMIPTAVNAVGTQDSADVAKLLSDTKAVAVRLKTDSSLMESFTRSNMSWQSYAGKLNTIKAHINNAGQLLAKLKAADSAGSPRQQTTIKQIEPLLQEMAGNLSATITHLNDNQNKVHLPAFTGYVKTNYQLATDLEALVRASVDYGADKEQFARLSST
jgi:hypothetical protein